MTTLLLISVGSFRWAIFPLIPLLIKGFGLGAKKHLGKKIVTESAKEAAKDKAKEIIQGKKKKDEKGD